MKIYALVVIRKQENLMLVTIHTQKLLKCVADKPILLEMAVMKYGRLNGTTNLECAVEAEPPPTFTWYRNASKGEKEVLKNVVREGPHKSVAVVSSILLHLPWHSEGRPLLPSTTVHV